MPYQPDVDHRRSIRLPHYDYANAGAYFVTICTHNRASLFGSIVDGQMQLNSIGRIVEEESLRSSVIRDEIELDAFVIMPNHFHGIVFIKNDRQSNATVGATGRSPLHHGKISRGPAKKSLGALMAGFKSSATKLINRMRNTPCTPVWQRNYYEHVIRNENDLDEIRQYINNNPANLAEDKYNPRT